MCFCWFPTVMTEKTSLCNFSSMTIVFALNTGGVSASVNASPSAVVRTAHSGICTSAVIQYISFVD